MALPPGGLGQASQPKLAAQAPGALDVDAKQVENLESQAPALKDTVLSDLGDQREALNKALLQMRQSLDARKNRLFDPVLMQLAAGFLKPTKTGSFGESLGNAAESVGIASEREQVRQSENMKLEMELASKEQELRQQLGSDQLIRQLSGGMNPGGQQISPTGSPPAMAQPSAQPGGQNPQQVLAQASQGRIKITDEVLLLANRIAPKLLPTLQEMRKSQTEEEKIRLEQAKLDENTRMVTPIGQNTPRPMNKTEFAEYEKEVNNYYQTDDLDKIMAFYRRKGYVEPDQFRARVAQAGASGAGKTPLAQSSSEQAGEKAGFEATASERAKAAEKLASRLGLQAEAAFENSNIANDMIGYVKNNPLVFDIMNRPGLGNAIARAVEQGANAGNFNISLPASTIKQYELSSNDLTALQMFMQKSAQLQSRGRQLNRTPGEGSTSDYETKLLGGIYALPSDSQRAIILKSDALKMQGLFDEERFKLWSQKSKQSGYSYNDFLVDDDFKKIKTDYRKLLDRVREENLDLLAPKSKSQAATPSAPTQSGESPLERFKREQAERSKGKT